MINSFFGSFGFFKSGTLIDCGFFFAYIFGSISSQQRVGIKKVRDILKALQTLNLKPIWNVFNHEEIFGFNKYFLAVSRHSCKCCLIINVMFL